MAPRTGKQAFLAAFRGYVAIRKYEASDSIESEAASQFQLKKSTRFERRGFVPDIFKTDCKIN
jgi:hypothetical protein